MPAGATLSDGVHQFVATANSSTSDITGWQLDKLSVLPPANFSGALNLVVTATSKELSNGSTASQSQTMTLQVTAVADTPMLALQERDITTRQLVSTGFENVTNVNKDSDKLYWFDTGATGGDVWTATTAKTGKVIGFEFFSQGDTVTTSTTNNANTTTTSLTAAPYGKSWMMLHDGLGIDGKQKGYQLLGINRDVTTMVGMTYQVSFDFAAMLGLSRDELSRVQVYAGNTLLGTAQGASDSNLNWQHVMYSFVASAATTPIRIMLDGVALGDKELKGRMAMLDNLSVVEVLPARIGVTSAQVYALAGIANALPRLIVSSQDTDGSESYRVELKGVPAGVTISDGVYSITNTGNEPITMNLAGMDLSKLTIQTPTSYRGDMKLSVVSYSTEASNQSMAMENANFFV